MQRAQQAMQDYENAGGGSDGTRNMINRENPLRAPFEAGSGIHLMEGPQFGQPLSGEERAVQVANTVSMVASLGAGAPRTLRAVAADLAEYSVVATEGETI